MRSRFRTTTLFALVLMGGIVNGLGSEAAAAPGADKPPDESSVLDASPDGESTPRTASPSVGRLEARPVATGTTAATVQAAKTSGAAEANLLSQDKSPPPSSRPPRSPSEVASDTDESEGKTTKRDDAAIAAKTTEHKLPAVVDSSDTARGSDSPPSTDSTSSVSPAAVRPSAEESQGRQEALVTCITTKDGRARCRQGRGDIEALVLPRGQDPRVAGRAVPALASHRSDR